MVRALLSMLAAPSVAAVPSAAWADWSQPSAVYGDLTALIDAHDREPGASVVVDVYQSYLDRL